MLCEKNSAFSFCIKSLQAYKMDIPSSSATWKNYDFKSPVFSLR